MTIKGDIHRRLAARAAVALLLAAGVAGVRPATADVIVAPGDCSTPGLKGWLAGQNWANPSPADLAPRSGQGGAALIGLGPQPGDPGWYARVHDPSRNLFAGTITPGMWIDFDFWADSTIPEYVRLRWAAEDGRTWRYSVLARGASTVPLADWTRYESELFIDYMDWDFGGGSQQRFLDDLTAVNWIGVFVARGGIGVPPYGIDDFGLQVPEPGQWWMLGLGLTAAGACLWWRRRYVPAA
jgi:hypothetical protein